MDPSVSHCLSPPLSLSLSVTLSPAPLSVTLSLCNKVLSSLSVSVSLSVTLSVFLCLCLSVSLSHTHSNSLSLSLSNSLSLSLSLSLSVTFSSSYFLFSIFSSEFLIRVALERRSCSRSLGSHQTVKCVGNLSEPTASVLYAVLSVCCQIRLGQTQCLHRHE